MVEEKMRELMMGVEDSSGCFLCCGRFPCLFRFLHHLTGRNLPLSRTGIAEIDRTRTGLPRGVAALHGLFDTWRDDQ